VPPLPPPTARPLFQSTRAGPARAASPSALIPPTPAVPRLTLPGQRAALALDLPTEKALPAEPPTPNGLAELPLPIPSLRSARFTDSCAERRLKTSHLTADSVASIAQ
jgi:hypothetical protein